MLKSGALGEIAAMKHFISEGYEVYISVIDNAGYDMLLVKDEHIKRVEVKSTSFFRQGKYEVQLKSVRSNKTENKSKYFDNTKVDFLAIYIIPLNKLIVYNAKDVKSRTTMKIHLEGDLAGDASVALKASGT